VCAQYRIDITGKEEEEEEEEEETRIDNGEDLNRPHIFKELLLLLLGIYAAAVVKEPLFLYYRDCDDCRWAETTFGRVQIFDFIFLFFHDQVGEI
jgi:hypothetical protein